MPRQEKCGTSAPNGQATDMSELVCLNPLSPLSLWPGPVAARLPARLRLPPCAYICLLQSEVRSEAMAGWRLEELDGGDEWCVYIKGSTYPDKPDPGGWVPLRFGWWPLPGRKVRLIRASQLGREGPSAPPKSHWAGPGGGQFSPTPGPTQPTPCTHPVVCPASPLIATPPPPSSVDVVIDRSSAMRRSEVSDVGVAPSTSSSTVVMPWRWR